MKSRIAPARDGGELDRLDLDVDLLKQLWQRHGEVALDRFWQYCKSHGTGTRQEQHLALCSLIKTDLRCRFERGQTVEVNRYLDCFPDLRQSDSRVISLIYEEFCLREELGHAPEVEAFCDRYPAWKDSLQSQLQYHKLFSKAAGLCAANPCFPEVGDQFEEFQLVALIGKGGSSRVFLARDLSLGGKRVVLKVSLDRGQEPKTQGALDHPHIVPVNSVAFQPEAQLRGLSMPYRPGLPLDEIAKRVRALGHPRLARTIWNVLVEGTSSEPDCSPRDVHAQVERSGPTGDGWNGFPLMGSYAQGVAWIGMILAKTLHYAHGMQTFHRDVKPGNILLTLHHGPQLLDFNLAESPHAAQHAESALLGGTLPYMAPEQIEAFLNPDLWGRVSAQSDLYSLGLVLRELLTGQAPDLPDETLSPARAMRDLLDRRARLTADIRHHNPDVPHALEAIIERCLTFSPDDRYPDAQVMAVDLQRFLTRQPLRMAVNPSRRERLLNWGARNRRKFVSYAVYLVLVAALAYHWLAPLWKPDPATLPVILQAIQAIEQGQPGSAVNPLLKLVREYPDHPLPLTYLAIARALSQWEHLAEDDAQISMRQGLDLKNSEGVLLDWGRHNPSLARHLEEFVSAQFELMKQQQSVQAQRTTRAGKLSDEDRLIERTCFETMHKAIRIACKLDPSMKSARKLMAVTEDYLGNFESAYQIFSELIAEARLHGDRSDRFSLIDWTTQRGRVALHWSTKLRRDKNPAAEKRVINLVTDATATLKECATTVSDLADQTGLIFGDLQTVYNYYWISTEAYLARGEIEQRAGQRQAEHLSLRAAKHSFDLLDAFAREHSLQNSTEFDDLKARVWAGLRNISKGGVGTVSSLSSASAPAVRTGADNRR
jgi:serine/threonine protein kinase